MKLITKDNEIVEGEVVNEGLARFVDDVNNGINGVLLYSHQKREFIKYMVENFVLELKAQTSNVAPAESMVMADEQPFDYPPPVVAPPSDDPAF